MLNTDYQPKTRSAASSSKIISSFSFERRIRIFLVCPLGQLLEELDFADDLTEGPMLSRVTVRRRHAIKISSD
jgi:hypothetical protein